MYVLSLAPTHLKCGQMGKISASSTSEDLYNIIENAMKYSFSHCLMSFDRVVK